MAKDSRNGVGGEGTGVDEAASLETRIRLRARGVIDAIVEEELNAARGDGDRDNDGMAVELVPRYQRRSERVDDAILGVSLSGTNTRRIKGALAPLLRGGPLSKDAVLASRWPVGRGLRDPAPPRPGGGSDSVSRDGRLVSHGADRQTARARAGAGDAGRGPMANGSCSISGSPAMILKLGAES